MDGDPAGQDIADGDPVRLDLPAPSPGYVGVGTPHTINQLEELFKRSWDHVIDVLE